MSSSNCCFLTCIWVSQEADKLVWYSHLFKNFPVCCDPPNQILCYSQWSRNRFFFGIPHFFLYPMDVGNLISGSSAFFKSSLYIWKLSVHVLVKPGLKDCEHDLASMWNECNCMLVWMLFGIVLLWDWNENWPFPVLWPLLSFPNLLAYWVQHFNSIIF